MQGKCLKDFEGPIARSDTQAGLSTLKTHRFPGFKIADLAFRRHLRTVAQFFGLKSLT